MSRRSEYLKKMIDMKAYAEEPNQTAEEKILEGYAYSIYTDTETPYDRAFMMITGYGGALEYIAVCKRGGIPDEFIQDHIAVNIDGFNHKLKDVKVFKKTKR